MSFRKFSSVWLVGALAVVCFLIGARLIPGFDSRYSVISLLLLASFLGIAGVGETVVMIAGGIDLSVPYLIDVANVVAGELNGDGWSFWKVALMLLAIAAVMGGINGYVSGRLRVHPLVVTLGTGLVAQGLVLLWTHGMSTGTAPTWLTNAVSTGGQTGFIPVPAVILVWLLLGVMAAVLLHTTVYGRRLFALGSRPQAAELALVKRVPVWTTAYIISAISAVVVGVLLLGFTGGVDASVGDPYLFQTIAAVVVGGTSVLGGQGSYLRTALGAIVITEISNILIGLGFSEAVLETLLGLLIVVVVSTSGGRMPHIRNQI